MISASTFGCRSSLYLLLCFCDIQMENLLLDKDQLFVGGVQLLLHLKVLFFQLRHDLVICFSILFSFGFALCHLLVQRLHVLRHLSFMQLIFPFFLLCYLLHVGQVGFYPRLCLFHMLYELLIQLLPCFSQERIILGIKVNELDNILFKLLLLFTHQLSKSISSQFSDFHSVRSQVQPHFESI